MSNPHRDALLSIHRSLYPENYPPEVNVGHEHWDDVESPEDAPECYEWDSGTIEWVADAIARALEGDPDLRAEAA